MALLYFIEKLPTWWVEALAYLQWLSLRMMTDERSASVLYKCNYSTHISIGIKIGNDPDSLGG